MTAAPELVTVGRVNMDLFSQDIGAEFEDVTGFDAMVGGSPANIAIGTARLGLRSAVLTGIGDDAVGRFILRYLRDAGVDTTYVFEKPGKLSSLALLAVIPPSRFPLSFYREDPADIHVNVDDAATVPWEEVAAVQLSGNAFSRGPGAAASEYAGKRGQSAGATVFMDLDLRPSEWPAAAEFGRVLRRILPLCDVVVGTEEEFYAALMDDPSPVIDGSPVPGSHRDDLEEHIVDSRSLGPSVLVVKRGSEGATILDENGHTDVAGFPVDVVNTVGAGDAFASGLITRRLRGDGWERAVRYANACGAITVSRHGCSVALPTADEVEAFVGAQGGR